MCHDGVKGGTTTGWVDSNSKDTHECQRDSRSSGGPLRSFATATLVVKREPQGICDVDQRGNESNALSQEYASNAIAV